MQTHGQEVHESTEEARAGSTPNIVRWVLAISLLAAILLLSAIWIFGAATTDEEDRVANATDRIEMNEPGSSTDSIVSDQPSLIEGGDTGDTPVATEPAEPE